LHLGVRTVHLHEPGLDDAREGRISRGTELDGSPHVSRQDALLHRRQEHVLVDGALVEINGSLDGDADGNHEPEEDAVHHPAALFKLVSKCRHVARSSLGLTRLQMETKRWLAAGPLSRKQTRRSSL